MRVAWQRTRRAVRVRFWHIGNESRSIARYGRAARVGAGTFRELINILSAFCACFSPDLDIYYPFRIRGGQGNAARKQEKGVLPRRGSRVQGPPAFGVPKPPDTIARL